MASYRPIIRYFKACSGTCDYQPCLVQVMTMWPFSVATTSTKAPAILKTDIWRVLDSMQVKYRETKTRFDCIHLPSIDISSLQDPHGTPTPSPRKHRKQGLAGSDDSGGHDETDRAQGIEALLWHGPQGQGPRRLRCEREPEHA